MAHCLWCCKIVGIKNWGKEWGSDMDFSFWIVVVILVLAVIWFICREFFCWYWKINERRDILSAIHDDLSVLYDMQKSLSQLKDICFSLDSLKNSIDESKQRGKKTAKAVSVSDGAPHSEKHSDESSSNIETEEEFSFVTKNGRTFVTKHGYYYCPLCHAEVVNETASSCSNCGRSFMG